MGLLVSRLQRGIFSIAPPTPLQTFLLGILQIGLGIGILFLPIRLHVIAWVLILLGSMIIFLAIYLWFTTAINKAINETSENKSK